MPKHIMELDDAEANVIAWRRIKGTGHYPSSALCVFVSGLVASGILFYGALSSEAPVWALAGCLLPCGGGVVLMLRTLNKFNQRRLRSASADLQALATWKPNAKAKHQD
jgi:hypothetical protein